MAELLKREYELLALRVHLVPQLPSSENPAAALVQCVLERGRRGDLEQIDAWSFDPSEFGLPARIASDTRATSFRLPPMLIDALKAAIQSDSAPDDVLWLQFQRPYGYLPVLPWEDLNQAVGLVVLRLPDVLAPPPREAAEGLDLAVCASSPVAKTQFELVRAVSYFLQDAAAGMRRNVRIHVFADGRMVPELKAATTGMNMPNASITIYDPSAAASYEVPERARITDHPTVTNPWLLWMRDAMQGRSLDAVHFIGQGYVAQERGALALAESPVLNADTSWARFVAYAEMNTFLNQVGAWSIAFTTPQECAGDVGLRLLADQFGQQRPGSVLHHSAHLDPHWTGLMGAYQFLYSSAPATPRADPGVIIYCQPSRVARDQMLFELPEHDPSNEVLTNAFEGTDQVPGWLAASQRYFEQCAFQSTPSGKEEIEFIDSDPDESAPLRLTDLVNIGETIGFDKVDPLKRGLKFGKKLGSLNISDSIRSLGTYESTLKDLQSVVEKFTGSRGGKL